MDRDVMGELLAWKTSEYRKPLLLEGPRQVGKTWLLRELGSTHYEETALVDFEQTPRLRTIFDADLDPERILSQLRIATNTAILPGRTLVILDEIQNCPRALTALKYFNEQANDYHIACAGSLLGVALHEEESFPVGKVNFIRVGPLSFSEFLRAIGEERLLDALTAHHWDWLSPFHDHLVGLLRDYFFVGGMPAVVTRFLQSRDYAGARSAQEEILQAYERDFSKHAPAEQVPKIRAVWQSIPGQLAKEQRRFLYSDLASGARARTHQTAIDWLSQAGVILPVRRVLAPRLPLSGYVDPDAFKLYLADIGLLGALASVSPRTVLEPNRLFTEFRGSLTEQYAAMTLTAAFARTPHYWTNAGGTAEVDFVVQRDQDVVPVEVKATLNLKSQSLRVYREKFSPALSVRTSLHPYAHQPGLVDLPLYALGELPHIEA